MVECISEGKEMVIVLLQNFVPFDFSEGVAYVSVTKNGITFNKAVMSKLNYPCYAVLLINKANGQIALQGHDHQEPRSLPFYKGVDKKAVSVRWNGKDLLNTLSEMMGWDLTTSSYRIDGKLIPEERAILFDLQEAKNLDSQQ